MRGRPLHPPSAVRYDARRAVRLCRLWRHIRAPPLYPGITKRRLLRYVTCVPFFILRLVYGTHNCYHRSIAMERMGTT